MNDLAAKFNKERVRQMKNGYIKLYRKITEWSWHDEPITLSVFIHLLLDANREDTMYHDTYLRAGQLVLGQEIYAEKCGISRQQLRTALKHLELTNNITLNVIKGQRPTNVGTIITIVNYSDYQAIQPQSNHETTMKQPQNNHETTMKQPVTRSKEVKNIRNNIYIVEQAAEQEKNTERDNLIDEIIKYLNSKTGKDFRLKNKNTRKLISGRLAEGYKLEDFKSVINKKWEEWENTDLEKFVRPDTLFRPSHFESYLNQRIVTPKPTVKKTSFDNFEERPYDENWEKEFMRINNEKIKRDVEKYKKECKKMELK